MRKTLWLVLACALALGVAGTAAAATSTSDKPSHEGGKRRTRARNMAPTVHYIAGTDASTARIIVDINGSITAGAVCRSRRRPSLRTEPRPAPSPTS